MEVCLCIVELECQEYINYLISVSYFSDCLLDKVSQDEFSFGFEVHKKSKEGNMS